MRAQKPRPKQYWSAGVPSTTRMRRGIDQLALDHAAPRPASPHPAEADASLRRTEP